MQTPVKFDAELRNLICYQLHDIKDWILLVLASSDKTVANFVDPICVKHL
jgi:hypothetical protein